MRVSAGRCFGWGSRIRDQGKETNGLDSDARRVPSRYQRLSPDGVKREAASDGERLGVSGAPRRKLGWSELYCLNQKHRPTHKARDGVFGWGSWIRDQGKETNGLDSDARRVPSRYQRLSPDGVKREAASDGERLGVSGAPRRKLGWSELYCLNQKHRPTHKARDGVFGWGSWIRTSECRSQSPVPYRLAIPHRTEVV